MANEIHKNDEGTEFLVAITDEGVAVDLSNATLLNIVIVKSDNTKMTKTAVFTTVLSGGTGDGTDGKISYISEAGDLDVIGVYGLQGKVTTPDGLWHSTIDKFKVFDNL